MTECLKNAASDAVTRRTGTVKAVIETVFRRHQLACTVRVTEEGGVVDRFGLRAEPGVAFEAVAALAPELARELGVAAVRVTEYAIDRTFAGWGIEVPHPPAARQYKTWRELTESECLESTGALEVTLLLGATVLGEPVAVDLATLPHLVIAGGEKTGKTTLMHSLILSLLTYLGLYERRLVLIDASVRATAASTVVTGSAYGTVTREAGGELTGMSRTGVNLGVTAGAAESIERQQSSQYAAGFSGSETQTVRTGSATTSDVTTGVSRTFASALNDTVANSVGHGSTWNQQSASGSVRTASDMTEAVRMNQVTEGTTVQTQGSWQAGVSAAALGAGAARAGGVAAAVAAVPGVGVRGAVQAADTESLIDQATGRTAALQSRESREAYQTVHDAAQRIAATHTDAAVRSEAANFLTTLSRRRQAALEKATGLSDTVSVLGSRSESAAGRTATTVDDSASLMAASVACFGSAEGALRALNRAEGRTALATSAQEAAQAGMDSAAFGAGAMASPLPHSEDADAARKAQYRRAAVGAHLTDTVTAEAEAVKARSEKRPSGFGLTEDATEKMAAAVESRGTIGADETAFRRGLLMIARETYRTENADKNYALRNAFLAGIGYQDTGSLQASLKAKAASDPVLRSAVASVGAKNTSEVGASDWTALVKAARGAVRE